jgi:hypothetical protein
VPVAATRLKACNGNNLDFVQEGRGTAWNDRARPAASRKRTAALARFQVIAGAAVPDPVQFIPAPGGRRITSA